MLNIKNWSVYLDRLIEKISQVSDLSQQFKAMVTNAARSGVGEAPAPSSGGKVVVTDPNVHKAAPQAQAKDAAKEDADAEEEQEKVNFSDNCSAARFLKILLSHT